MAVEQKRTLEKTQTPGVYRRGKSYMVTYRVHGKQRKRYARTYDEARALKATLATDIRRGEHRELRGVTFGEYVTEWLDSYSGRTVGGLRQSTKDGYRWSLETKAVPFFRDRVAKLPDIEPRDVRAYVAWLFDAKAQGRELAVNTVRAHVASLKVLMASALEDGVLRYNPAAQVRVSRPGAPVKPEKARVRAMDSDQLAALLNAVDPDWRLFFELLAATGCRIGEALELRWSDVDLGAKRISVSRQIYHGAVGPPKSDTGVREIPLSTAMCRRLWRLQGTGDELLFTGPRGMHVDRRWLARRVLDPATEKAGVPWVSFHVFRHTCASVLFAAGKSPKQVQVWLGHSDPAFTLRVYVHLLDDGLGSADFLDEAKWSDGATMGQHDPRQTQATDPPAIPRESAG
jgi:integrase